MPEPDPNPFRIAGELLPHEMIDREQEVAPVSYTHLTLPTILLV